MLLAWDIITVETAGMMTSSSKEQKRGHRTTQSNDISTALATHSNGREHRQVSDTISGHFLQGLQDNMSYLAANRIEKNAQLNHLINQSITKVFFNANIIMHCTLVEGLYGDYCATFK